MKEDNSQNVRNEIETFTDDKQNRGDIRIPVIHEKLIADKKSIETGKVLISKKVVKETSSIDQKLIAEQVVINRKEINQYVDAAPPAVRQEGDVTIISVVKEVLVVEKKLMLVEEIHVTKQKTEVNEHQEITLRREQVDITKDSSGTEI